MKDRFAVDEFGLVPFIDLRIKALPTRGFILQDGLNLLGILRQPGEYNIR